MTGQQTVSDAGGEPATGKRLAFLSLAAVGIVYGDIGTSPFFLVIDLGFWVANLPKIPDGGWFPLVVAAGMFTLMTTWKAGRRLLRGHIRGRTLYLEDFTASIAHNPLTGFPVPPCTWTRTRRGCPRRCCTT